MNNQAFKRCIAVLATALAVAVPIGIQLRATVESARKGAMDAHRAAKFFFLYNALGQYAEAHGVFPPAGATDGATGPAHSWRVLLLPFLDQRSLYSQVRLDEPWDSPANQRLLKAMPEDYRSPCVKDKGSLEANYFAVMGPQTPWCHRDGGPRPGPSRDAIMLIELPGSKTPWMKPYDPTLEELLDMLLAKADTSAACADTSEVIAFTMEGRAKRVSLKTNRESLRKVILGEKGSLED
jgi:hypothetical protein